MVTESAVTGSEATGSEAGPLAGLRVLEFDDGLAQYCGKLLADMGAEVIKIEPPEGAPSRHQAPFAGDRADLNGSLKFWHYNTNKRSVVLDLAQPQAQQVVRALSQRADIVLDGLAPGRMDEAGLGAEQLRALNPGLIYTRVTPFGLDGPWSGFASSDLVQLALGGTMAMCGYDDYTGPDAIHTDGIREFPMAPTGGHAAHMASVLAMVGTMAALNARERTQQGQVVDVAAHDVISTSNEMGIPAWEFQRLNVHRHTGRHANVSPVTDRQMHRCGDGRYAICLTLYLIIDRGRFLSMAEWFDSKGLADDLLDEKYESASYRAENSPHITDVISAFVAQMDSTELFHGAQQRRLPWAPVNGPWDLIKDPHLREDRGAIVDGFHPSLGRAVAYPGAPYKFSKTPWQLRTVAPDLGSDNASVLADLE
jgi:crotonobetainyl-CoA:carnitine CoA-transferase CaiB-like acyl-CoA transferase